MMLAPVVNDLAASLPSKHLPIILGGLVLLAVYYWAGRRRLGPDDDWWSPLRRTVLPLLDRVLERAGGYATSRLPRSQQVAIANATPERVERALWKQGYQWNFAASLKRDPGGRVEYSSWAKRQLRQPQLRRVFAALEGLPVLGGPVELLEGALARRQVHAMLFDTPAGTTVYAHEEPNALNPLLFVSHYLGGRARSLLGRPVDHLSSEHGIRMVEADLHDSDVEYVLSDPARDVLRSWNGGNSTLNGGGTGGGQ